MSHKIQNNNNRPLSAMSASNPLKDCQDIKGFLLDIAKNKIFKNQPETIKSLKEIARNAPDKTYSAEVQQVYLSVVKEELLNLPLNPLELPIGPPPCLRSLFELYGLLKECHAARNSTLNIINHSIPSSPQQLKLLQDITENTPDDTFSVEALKLYPSFLQEELLRLQLDDLLKECHAVRDSVLQIISHPHVINHSFFSTDKTSPEKFNALKQIAENIPNNPLSEKALKNYLSTVKSNLLQLFNYDGAIDCLSVIKLPPFLETIPVLLDIYIMKSFSQHIIDQRIFDSEEQVELLKKIIDFPCDNWSNIQSLTSFLSETKDNLFNLLHSYPGKFHLLLQKLVTNQLGRIAAGLTRIIIPHTPTCWEFRERAFQTICQSLAERGDLSRALDFLQKNIIHPKIKQETYEQIYKIVEKTGNYIDMFQVLITENNPQNLEKFLREIPNLKRKELIEFLLGKKAYQLAERVLSTGDLIKTDLLKYCEDLAKIYLEVDIQKATDLLNRYSASFNDSLEFHASQREKFSLFKNICRSLKAKGRHQVAITVANSFIYLPYTHGENQENERQLAHKLTAEFREELLKA